MALRFVAAIMPTPQKIVSKVWEHFTRFPEKIEGKNAECKLCKKRFSYTSSTANLWAHIQNQHGIINPDSMYFKSAKGSQERAKQSIGDMFKNNTKYLRTSHRYQDITHHLAKYIIQEYLPLKKIESSAFRKYTGILDPR